MDEYILGEDSPFDLRAVAAHDARWTEFPHAHQRMRGLLLLAGEQLVLPCCLAGHEPWLSLTFLRGLPSISVDGLVMQVHLEVEDTDVRLVDSARFDDLIPAAGYRDWEIGLPVEDGACFRLIIRCDPGPAGRREADWLALVCLAIGDRMGCGRRRAKSLHDWRLANEVAHFSSVYDQAIYKDPNVVRSERAGTPIEHPDAIPVAAMKPLASMAPATYPPPDPREIHSAVPTGC